MKLDIQAGVIYEHICLCCTDYHQESKEMCVSNMMEREDWHEIGRERF